MATRKTDIPTREAARADVPAHPIDISNLAACTEDARQAALDMDRGPEDPVDFDSLRARLAVAREKLPPLYRTEFADPFINHINQLGRQGFQRVLIRDPERNREAGLMLDIAHAILQNGEAFQSRATDDFQEVVSDLYDGFLSAEDRRGVRPPDLGVTPPLVKWGNPQSGPYTWPANATRIFDVTPAVVSLPPANARKGILAWSALGHETAGHDVLHADAGLEDQIASAVRGELETAGLHDLAAYWSDRIDETASDVMGILNMGPAAAIGLVGYFRGLNAAFNGNARLSNVGGADEHPADILRGFLGAEVVRFLRFSKAAAWADVIQEEVNKDVGVIRLGRRRIDADQARRSAQIVANVIANHPMRALEMHSLRDIQDWRDRDEDVVAEIRTGIATNVPLGNGIPEGMFAAHVVSAAVYSALSAGANIPIIFERMLGLLKVMHDANPSWGPLFVRRPGNIRREFVFPAVRTEATAVCLPRSVAKQVTLNCLPDPTVSHSTPLGVLFPSDTARLGFCGCVEAGARAQGMSDPQVRCGTSNTIADVIEDIQC